MKEIVKKDCTKEAEIAKAKQQHKEIMDLFDDFTNMPQPERNHPKPILLTDDDFRIIKDALLMHAAVINLLQIGGGNEVH